MEAKNNKFDPRVELREVQEELTLIQTQLESLCQRQDELIKRKSLLQEAIKDAAAVDNRRDWAATNFTWSEKLVSLAKSVFGISKFRPLQLQTMNATLSKKDCILIMPTGGGKSLCFQLPAIISKGFTLVVCPLVSLMEDQLMTLRSHKVAAELLNSSTPREEVTRIQNAMTDAKSDMKLLYVTPEKLAKSKRFMAKLEKAYASGRLAGIAIDEVHCCSQWGHDFRPDYKFLGVLKRQFPEAPILGLTATATSSVVRDVLKILAIPQCVQFRASFNRHNLHYEVRLKPSNHKECIQDIQQIIESRFKGLSGIIYCFSRKDTEDVARDLSTCGIRASPYHADIPANVRSQVHSRWITGNIQVVVATVAFGMGIDKPNVRFVLHHSLSKSMENYYQESGRAGRDDAQAHCILYQSFADVFRQSTMVFTEQTGLEKLYGMAGYAYDVHTCRRKLIAHHFGEQWESTLCKGKCDHCDAERKGGMAKRDITQHCRDLVSILKQATATKQRVTALKLIEAWCGRGSTSLRVSSVKPPRLSRQQCDAVVVYLLLHSYLREDFHFTPYSTISYLLPGNRSQLLQGGNHTIEMEFYSSTAVNQNSAAAKKTTSSAVGDKANSTIVSGTHGKNTGNAKELKLSSKHSSNSPGSREEKQKHSTSSSGGRHKHSSSSSGNREEKHKHSNASSGSREEKHKHSSSSSREENANNSVEVNGVNQKKRKVYVIESDSDDDFAADIQNKSDHKPPPEKVACVEVDSDSGSLELTDLESD